MFVYLPFEFNLKEPMEPIYKSLQLLSIIYIYYILYFIEYKFVNDKLCNGR